MRGAGPSPEGSWPGSKRNESFAPSVWALHSRWPLVFRRVAIAGLVLMTGAASASEGVENWLRRCEARVESVRKLEARLAQLFDAQRSLQDDITARKAARDGGGPELRALLESSLRLEAELEAGLDQRDTLRKLAAQDCDRGIERARNELRRLQPLLRTGPLKERRAAARSIQGLRSQLSSLDEFRRVLSPPEDQVGLAWSDLPLEVDPLDGPEDLEGKADFVEDARDRLREKRALLAELYVQSRQAKALRRAARDFVTDIQIFDESARSPQSAQATTNTRNEQTGGGGGDASADDNFTDGPGAPSPVGGSEDGIPSTPTNGREAVGGLDGFEGEGGVIPPSFILEPGATPPPSETPSDGGSNLSSGVSPSFLLNLRVDQLEDRKLDLRTLEKLLEDMARLDEVLAAKAVEMRMKAKELGRIDRP